MREEMKREEAASRHQHQSALEMDALMVQPHLGPVMLIQGVKMVEVGDEKECSYYASNSIRREKCAQ